MKKLYILPACLIVSLFANIARAQNSKIESFPVSFEDINYFRTIVFKCAGEIVQVMGDEGAQLTDALQKEKNQFKGYLYSPESSSLIEFHDAKNGQDVGFVKDDLRNVGFYVRSQVKTSLVGYSSGDRGNLYHYNVTAHKEKDLYIASNCRVLKSVDINETDDNINDLPQLFQWTRSPRSRY